MTNLSSFRRITKPFLNLPKKMNTGTTITVQVEFIDHTGKFGCFDVELNGNPVMQDDSYDDEFGTVKIDPYYVLDGDPTWRRKDYSELQNVQIADYVAANPKLIEDLFIKEFLD